MNYLKTYINLVKKAQNQPEPVFYEKHHIFPKSIYGENKSIIKLTPRQHYIAHALLYKALIKRYGVYNRRSVKMIYAFWSMQITTNLNANKYSNPLLYKKLRSVFREVRQEESKVARVAR